MGRPWPITVDHLQQFAIHFHFKGLAPHTIQGRLLALAFFAKAHGCLDLAGDFCVKKMIEGWNKERGKQLDMRTPISPRFLAQLSQVWEDVCIDQYEVKLFRAATLGLLVSVNW